MINWIFTMYSIINAIELLPSNYNFTFMIIEAFGHFSMHYELIP